MGCPAGVIAAVGQCKDSKLYYLAGITEVAAPYSRPGGTGRSTGGTVWVGCCPRDCIHHAKIYWQGVKSGGKGRRHSTRMVLAWGCVGHGRANLPVVGKKIAIE